jgi:hypothetical protein
MTIRSALNIGGSPESKGGLLPETGAVLGLDVGYSPLSKSSAVCRLTWDARGVSWTLRRFRFREDEWLDAIRAVASETVLLAAAFDGPLRRGLLPGRAVATGWASVTNHDDRAALVCALTALGVASGNYVAVGDDDGWIVLPPRALVRNWSWADLMANAGNSLALVAAEPSSR